MAGQRAVAAEELAAIAQDKLMQRADLDSERLEFADDRTAEWVRIYKVSETHRVRGLFLTM